ncbi:butyrophilin-like protein 2 [Monodelphis domestica]|uniref:butyrophilin-like protein 2 n=1 Tax=Monodelphis domestica TaxID=13616 RepID=UPI0024E259C4|nr:butyrophilin-like protein 2 [Monodelphis domestica]
MDVIWFHDQSDLVHQYRYEKDYLKQQHLDYQGRTEFLRQNISRGNVALRLHHVRPSDEGKYRCYFARSTYNREAEFQVDVASTGSSPHLHIEGAGNKRVRVVCTSAGWYPEPEVHWRNQTEESLSQGTTISRKENGLFSVETSITVSADSKEIVSCVIENPLLSQKLEASVSLAGEFIVLGPQQPIIALVDRDVTFPCHLSPQLDAQHMDVIWFHDQSGLVHQYKYEKDYLKYQHLDYQERTEFLHENISRGNVALLLHRVRHSDEGKYRCYFASSTYNDEAEFQVYVASTGSTPHLQIEGAGNKRVRVVCTSAGWYPEPEVHWRNQTEESLSQGTTISRKENGLFSVETSINVSADSKEIVSCVIENPLLSQKLEASVSLAGLADPVIESCTARTGTFIRNPDSFAGLRMTKS